ncbi:MAG: hypothetical protein U0T32_01495 [Chitinophagales bacterium]
MKKTALFTLALATAFGFGFACKTAIVEQANENKKVTVLAAFSSSAKTQKS